MATWKLFDWVCRHCHGKHEAMVSVNGTLPETLVAQCPLCTIYTHHDRCKVNLFARYTGEHARQDPRANPLIHGGRFDTLGAKALPDLPDLPGVDAVEEKMGDDLARGMHVDDVATKYRNELPSTMDYKTLFAKPEWKDAKRERQARKKENALKKRRARALKRGDVNLRTSRVAGDAKEHSK